VNLWIPHTVADARAAARHFTVHLGLSEVDSWRRPGETGVVLAAGRAYLEFVSPGEPTPAPLAFELATRDAVDRVYSGIAPADVSTAPRRYPRGHYGFEARGPAGTQLMIWSERDGD